MMRWSMGWLTTLLALAMVLSPALGQMHRAVHAVNRQLKELQGRARRAPSLSRGRQEAPRNRRLARAMRAIPGGA